MKEKTWFCLRQCFSKKTWLKDLRSCLPSVLWVPGYDITKKGESRTFTTNSKLAAGTWHCRWPNTIHLGIIFFSFAGFLFPSLRARYKNRQSVSFSAVVMGGSSKITYIWAVSINSGKIRKPILSKYFCHTNKQTWYHSYVINLVFYLHPVCLPMPCQPSDPRDLGMTAPKRKFWECEAKGATVDLRFPLFIAARRRVVLKNREGTSYFYFSTAPSLYIVNHCLTDLGAAETQKIPRWAEHRSSGAMGSGFKARGFTKSYTTEIWPSKKSMPLVLLLFLCSYISRFKETLEASTSP